MILLKRNRNKQINFICMLGILGFLFFCMGSCSGLETILSGSKRDIRMKHLPEEGCWIVDHSVTYWTILGGPNKGKVMRFPVYNGKGSEIDEEELYSQISKSGSDPNIAQRYCVIIPAGEVEKTVREILDFYSKSILKGVDILHPEYIRECNLRKYGSCEIDAGYIDGFMHRDLIVDGIAGSKFGISYPSSPGKTVTVRNIWDIPIAEKGGWDDEANIENRKDAIIKWSF